MIVVSGNDPFLHRTAGPLYREILGRRAELAAAAGAAGAELAREGVAVPLSERSLHRHLFLTEGEGRRFLEQGEAAPASGALRPGVLLRSPLQDWLLHPQAVVVGPGELAYLRQLEPVYRALEVHRSALVPRLFAWLVPRGFDRHLLSAFTAEAGVAAPAVGDLAVRAAERAEAELRLLLERELGTDPQRAHRLARGRARRWSRSVAVVLEDEARRLARESRPSEPVWVFPEGSRQERVLSSLTAAALWGGALGETLIAAASLHLDHGRQDQWADMVIEVDEPQE